MDILDMLTAGFWCGIAGLITWLSIIGRKHV